MEKMTVNERNKYIVYFLNSCISKARQKEYHIKGSEISEFNELFSSTAWGFREIVLVIAVAKHLDASFSPTTDLYSCNPRSLYENSIRNVLHANGIPHRKSGPLNIAKATQGLNEAWAAQREPKRLGNCVVRLAKYVEELDQRELNNFTVSLLDRFLSEAMRVESINVSFDVETDPSFLHRLCAHMIDEAPDAGNTPQRITGTLLWCYHLDIHSGVSVKGFLDRASVTSTTSKKPGDINEETRDGKILSVYEVTVKPFGADRINESFDTIRIYNESTNADIDEVKVICRSADCPIGSDERVSTFFFGSIQHHGIEYLYIDIYQWMASLILNLSRDMRREFHELIQKYVSDYNTAETVKNAWRDFHSE